MEVSALRGVRAVIVLVFGFVVMVVQACATAGQTSTDAPTADAGTGADVAAADAGGCDGCSKVASATCSDGTQNGAETDIDCGGGAPCAACAAGQSCKAATDCAGGVCKNGKCASPSCIDGVKNAGESDVDCGGASCPSCANGKACVAASDCASVQCTSGRCAAITCTDHLKNGDESDVDCGGGTCPTCATGKGCRTGADCASGACPATTCAAPSCTDHVKNGAETDVDCGGGACPGCPTGGPCATGADCASQLCTSGACVAPSCSDGVKNGAETGIDCGGSDCGACPNGQGCINASDCQTAVCMSHQCVDPTCSDGAKNGSESDVDCGGGTCPLCVDGRDCNGGSDCVSGSCTGGSPSTCAAPTCTDGVQNGAETGVDCGGTCPDACLTGLTIEGPASVPLGTAPQYTARAHYGDGTTGDVSASASWTSTVTDVATIDSNGNGTTVAEGTTDIQVSYGGFNADEQLTVLPACLGGRASTACGTACVDLDTNHDNCGACTVACGAGERCSGGVCGVVADGGADASDGGVDGSDGGDAGDATLGDSGAGDASDGGAGDGGAGDGGSPYFGYTQCTPGPSDCVELNVRVDPGVTAGNVVVLVVSRSHGNAPVAPQSTVITSSASFSWWFPAAQVQAGSGDLYFVFVPANGSGATIHSSNVDGCEQPGDSFDGVASTSGTVQCEVLVSSSPVSTYSQIVGYD